jgi:nucleotide-binding universal stress UspA family protein
MAGEIVVGYDGTESSQAALETALELAKDSGSKLVVVYGYDPTRMGGEVRDLDQVLEERGREVTEEAAGKAKKAGIEAAVAVVKVKPSAALAELAASRGARLIVVGGYGERPIKGAIIGSTPHKLLHISSVPVVVVPPPE